MGYLLSKVYILYKRTQFTQYLIFVQHHWKVYNNNNNNNNNIKDYLHWQYSNLGPAKSDNISLLSLYSQLFRAERSLIDNYVSLLVSPLDVTAYTVKDNNPTPLRIIVTGIQLAQGSRIYIRLLGYSQSLILHSIHKYT